MNRREFLQYSSLTPLIGSVPSAFAQTAKLQRPERILVLVELQGGNDGLSTLVPYEDDNYHNNRPRLRIQKTLPLQKLDMGMNPYLKRIKPLWEDGDMAWLQNVGYPNASRSHFHSADIWQTGNLDPYEMQGWVNRILTFRQKESHDLKGIVLGDSKLGPLSGLNSGAVAMDNPYEFLRQTKYLNKKDFATSNDAMSHLLKVQKQINVAADLLYEKLKSSKPSPVRFPYTHFGRSLQQVDRMISSGMHLPVYKVSLKGFDTHANQRDIHNNLMNHLGEGLDAFVKAMKHQGLWDDVLILTYSEFGRRVQENGSFGTDHGSGSVNMVLGGRVNGNLYGTAPRLDKDSLIRGDIAHRIDFRQLYATVAQRWWRKPNPWPHFKPMPFV